jgi:hypothetical protein
MRAEEALEHESRPIHPLVLGHRQLFDFDARRHAPCVPAHASLHCRGRERLLAKGEEHAAQVSAEDALEVESAALAPHPRHEIARHARAEPALDADGVAEHLFLEQPLAREVPAPEALHARRRQVPEQYIAPCQVAAVDRL